MTKLTVSDDSAKPIPTTTIPIITEIPKPRSKLNLMKSALLLGCVTMSLALALCLLIRAVEASREQAIVIPVPRWVGDEPEYPKVYPPAVGQKNSSSENGTSLEPGKPTTYDPSSQKNSSENNSYNGTVDNKGGESGNFEIVVVTTCIISGFCSRSADCCNGACAWVPGLSRPWCVQIVDMRLKNSVYRIVGTDENDDDSGSDSSEEDGTTTLNYDSNSSNDSSDGSSDVGSDSDSDSDEDGGWPNNENESIKESSTAKNNLSDVDNKTGTVKLSTASPTERSNTEKHHELFTELMPIDIRKPSSSPKPAAPSTKSPTATPTTEPSTATQKPAPRNFYENWIYNTVTNINNLIKSLS